MPSLRARFADLDDRLRCERAADILARGVLRHLLGRRPGAEESGDSGLEVSRETRLNGVAVDGERAAPGIAAPGSTAAGAEA